MAVLANCTHCYKILQVTTEYERYALLFLFEKWDTTNRTAEEELPKLLNVAYFLR